MSNHEKNDKNGWKSTPPELLDPVFREPILVADLVIGDTIFTPRGHGTKVMALNPCPGMLNRTHIHINATQCYDSRSYVKLVSK